MSDHDTQTELAELRHSLAETRSAMAEAQRNFVAHANALLLEMRELHYQLERTRRDIAPGQPAAPVERAPQPASVRWEMPPVERRVPRYASAVSAFSDDEFEAWHGSLTPGPNP